MGKLIHVILTGGVGSRLWPLSRKSRPKQYLEIFENKSLFEMSVARNAALVDQVMVVGNVDNSHLSEHILKKLDKEYIDIIEATPRNTAAAIAFAALASNPDDILLVTPSDHVIEGDAVYNEAIEIATKKAQQGYIVTFGIVPTKPETGYGYIEYKGDDVIAFHEKPNKGTAQGFIATGNFLWNSGMFCFKASVMLEEIKKYTPEVCKKAALAWANNIAGKLDYKDSMEIPSISIDYAVMELSEKIKVVPAAFQWSDLGSFEAVYDYLVSKKHPIDADNNMVLGTDLHTTFVGLKNTIFVHTPTANLILQKEASQQVKKVYENLRKQGACLLE